MVSSEAASKNQVTFNVGDNSTFLRLSVQPEWSARRSCIDFKIPFHEDSREEDLLHAVESFASAPLYLTSEVPPSYLQISQTFVIENIPSN